MRTSIFVAGLLALACFTARSTAAGQYPVKPEAGAWMVLVQSYAGDVSAQLADDLCASLRRDYKVAAYVFDRGEEERFKERQRIAEVKRKMRAQAKAAGLPEDSPLPPIKTHHIEPQYAVLVGGWKDQETARKALDEIRKLKPPADKFLHKEVVLTRDAPQSDYKMKTESVNPFKSAFVVRNPTVPLPPDPEKGKLQNLKEYNEDESYSLLKCRKPYTLVVKSYNGAVQVAGATAAPSGMFKQAGGNKPGQLLNAGAMQAHELAKALSMLKDSRGKAMIKDDIYVLHTEHSSYVTIGGFNQPDDPQLKQLQKTLAGLQFGPSERLMVQPMPMPVPKP